MQHSPIAFSSGERPPDERDRRWRRRLLALLAWPLDRTGLTGWRLVGAVAVVVGGLWLATELVWVFPLR